MDLRAGNQVDPDETETPIVERARQTNRDASFGIIVIVLAATILWAAVALGWLYWMT